ncbi:MAG: hypothetical protein IT364_16485 [Candidatus Hydrogenedentes bacterium]|nr:hypothetical protein [Candidatus Hydrogenedentota bacterium]
MSRKRFRISDGYPIGLRKVPFMFHLSVRAMLKLLTEEFVHDAPLKLDVYAYVPKRPPTRVEPEELGSLIADAMQSDESALRAVPPQLFVWSNEVRQADRAFSRGVEPAPGELIARGPNWEPYTGPYTELVDECPDFSGMLRKLQARVEQDTDKAQRARRWKAIFNELRSKDPNVSYSTAARHIVTSGLCEGYSERTIRRALAD